MIGWRKKSVSYQPIKNLIAGKMFGKILDYLINYPLSRMGFDLVFETLSRPKQIWNRSTTEILWMVPFWFHFGSILVPFWLHFGCILVPFWLHGFRPKVKELHPIIYRLMTLNYECPRKCTQIDIEARIHPISVDECWKEFTPFCSLEFFHPIKMHWKFCFANLPLI